MCEVKEEEEAGVRGAAEVVSPADGEAALLEFALLGLRCSFAGDPGGAVASVASSRAAWSRRPRRRSALGVGAWLAVIWL